MWLIVRGAPYLCVAVGGGVQRGQVSDPIQARHANAAARHAGAESKNPRLEAADQLQAMPHIVRNKENSSEEHMQR